MALLDGSPPHPDDNPLGPVAELADAADLKSAGAYQQTISHKALNSLPETGGARFGAQTPQIDPDLQHLNDAWPSLPQPIRDALVAMVRAVNATELS